MAYAHFVEEHFLTGPVAGGVGDPISEPTLAVTDQGDGTGATATITGSDVGTTNTVYTQAFDGELGSDTWTSQGSRSGNGTIDMTLTTGHYLAYVVSSDGSQTQASNVVYFVVTSATESVYYQCLTGTRSRVQAVSLSGIENANIVAKKMPHPRLFSDDGSISLPCVLITPPGDRQPANEGTNLEDDVHYRVLVTVVSPDNQERTIAANLSRDLLWMQQISRAFRQQRLPGVDEVVTCRVQPGEAYVPAAWRNNYAVSARVLEFIAREPRGI